MAEIHQEHLHHLAKRNHKLMEALHQAKAKGAKIGKILFGTLEVGLGAYVGGVIHGRTMKHVDPVTGETVGATVGPIPMELAAGAAVLALGHFDILGEEWTPHVDRFGTGLVAAFATNKGYAFGERWKFGGLRAALTPWKHAAAPGLPAPAPAAAVHAAGDPSPAQMAQVVETMRQAAASAPR